MPAEITVLVPAHNDGAYLDANLRSLSVQSFGDFEAIVADDASSDATPEVARSWAARDARFRLSRIETNVGMNRNWNRALAEATGELVIKLDGDDAMTPRALETLRGHHAREPALLFSACRTRDCDPELRPGEPFRGDLAFRRNGLDPGMDSVRSGHEWLRICFEDAQPWHSCALLFRRTALLELGGWDERWISSDADLILRALATNRRVAHSSEFGILYRRRTGSSSQRERASGAARLELNMILLRRLAASAQDLRPWGRALRQNWWRLWRRFLADERDSRIWCALPPERRELLRRLANETAELRPPFGVRVDGELRLRIWLLLSRLRSRLRREPENGRSI